MIVGFLIDLLLILLPLKVMVSFMFVKETLRCMREAERNALVRMLMSLIVSNIKSYSVSTEHVRKSMKIHAFICAELHSIPDVA